MDFLEVMFSNMNPVGPNLHHILAQRQLAQQVSSLQLQQLLSRNLFRNLFNNDTPAMMHHLSSYLSEVIRQYQGTSRADLIQGLVNLLDVQGTHITTPFGKSTIGSSKYKLNMLEILSKHLEDTWLNPESKEYLGINERHAGVLLSSAGQAGVLNGMSLGKVDSYGRVEKGELDGKTQAKLNEWVKLARGVMASLSSLLDREISLQELLVASREITGMANSHESTLRMLKGKIDSLSLVLSVIKSNPLEMLQKFKLIREDLDMHNPLNKRLNLDIALKTVEGAEYALKKYELLHNTINNGSQSLSAAEIRVGAYDFQIESILAENGQNYLEKVIRDLEKSGDTEVANRLRAALKTLKTMHNDGADNSAIQLHLGSAIEDFSRSGYKYNSTIRGHEVTLEERKKFNIENSTDFKRQAVEQDINLLPKNYPSLFGLDKTKQNQATSLLRDLFLGEDERKSNLFLLLSSKNFTDKNEALTELEKYGYKKDDFKEMSLKNINEFIRIGTQLTRDNRLASYANQRGLEKLKLRERKFIQTSKYNLGLNSSQEGTTLLLGYSEDEAFESVKDAPDRAISHQTYDIESLVILGTDESESGKKKRDDVLKEINLRRKKDRKPEFTEYKDFILDLRKDTIKRLENVDLYKKITELPDSELKKKLIKSLTNNTSNANIIDNIFKLAPGGSSGIEVGDFLSFSSILLGENTPVVTLQYSKDQGRLEKGKLLSDADYLGGKDVALIFDKSFLEGVNTKVMSGELLYKNIDKGIKKNTELFKKPDEGDGKATDEEKKKRENMFWQVVALGQLSDDHAYRKMTALGITKELFMNFYKKTGNGEDEKKPSFIDNMKNSKIVLSDADDAKTIQTKTKQVALAQKELAKHQEVRIVGNVHLAPGTVLTLKTKEGETLKMTANKT